LDACGEKDIHACTLLSVSRMFPAMADIRKWKSKKIGVVIEVDYGKCQGVGKCVEVCPASVYEVVDGKATAPNIDSCVECCACQDACPVIAIKHHSCQ
jgi:NAD-dependent dihydropyrimidine dehydrogenase PreA subunit